MLLPRRPKLVIFDKDGTLIDFVAMWGNWAEEYIARMCTTVSDDLHDPLYELFGVDPVTHRIFPDGALAIAPEAVTQRRIEALLQNNGIPATDATTLVQQLWQPPDPAKTAHPCADLVALCAWLWQNGAIIAVATADNRAPTLSTMQSLGIASYVGTMACADDPGIAPKPAPDKVYAICATLGIDPADAIMIGDTPSDMLMGRAAGVMACIAVLTGVSSAEELAVHADVVLANVGHLAEVWPFA